MPQPYGSFGAAPVADQKCQSAREWLWDSDVDQKEEELGGDKPQQKWSSSSHSWSSSQRWQASECTETPACENADDQCEAWVHVASEEKSVATDEAAGTAAAISHKNEGTDVHVHVRFAQTTAGAGDEPPEAAGADEKEGTLRLYQ